jgi:aspartyl-tRNA(Asn)/glutamyl-tRNA(Gln) amidotransferase subunit A
MTFAEWQELSPERAAREVHARIEQRLTPAQRRAAIAQLCAEPELAHRLAHAPRSSPLRAVPFFAKDLYDVAGIPTFAGSTFLPEVRPTPASDGALVRAIRDTGAILAGKTQMHEFAYGITGENPHYGDCEHPWFPGRTTGGSSSGSAAVVAAGIAPLALGSDTGGSVRVPAAFCGLFGFRLQPAEPFIRDAFPLAPSYDTAGWFTAHADDMLAAYDALVGGEDSPPEPRGCYLEMPGLDPKVATACRNAAMRLAPMADAATRDELLHGFSASADTYNIVVSREAWEVHAGWAEHYRDRYDPAVWQRLNRVHALTAGQQAFAEHHTAAIQALWTRFFETRDFLVLAASPAAALTKAECTLENRMRVLALTGPASVGGLPVLTLPVPLPDGLTTGLQIIVRQARSAVVRWALARA